MRKAARIGRAATSCHRAPFKITDSFGTENKPLGRDRRLTPAEAGCTGQARAIVAARDGSERAGLSLGAVDPREATPPRQEEWGCMVGQALSPQACSPGPGSYLRRLPPTAVDGRVSVESEHVPAGCRRPGAVRLRLVSEGRPDGPGAADTRHRRRPGPWVAGSVPSASCSVKGALTRFWPARCAAVRHRGEQ
jgi:hypothetical protein